MADDIEREWRRRGSDGMTPSCEAMASRILAATGGKARCLVALAGPPAAGKSTLAERLCERINAQRPGLAVVMPMDGYHFDNDVLAPRGQLAIKGAPQTFDVDALGRDLERLRRDDRDVAVPVFDRPLDLARAGGRVITLAHRLVIVEGNYLLLDSPPWCELRPLFDLALFIEVADRVLVARLLERWRVLGQSREGAVSRTHDKDMLNARLVKARSVAPDWRWTFHAEDDPKEASP